MKWPDFSKVKKLEEPSKVFMENEKGTRKKKNTSKKSSRKLISRPRAGKSLGKAKSSETSVSSNKSRSKLKKK